MKRRILVAIALVIGVVFFATHRTAWALVRYWSDPHELVIPVAGIEPRKLESSFGAPRSEHRKHEGIDIFARRGTKVVAAAQGRVIRVGHNRLGGNVVWVAGAGARLYYYAHLDRFSVSAGDTVDAGDELGRVGNSGNARTTPAHLHFGVYPMSRGFRAVDPAPLLVRNRRPK